MLNANLNRMMKNGINQRDVTLICSLSADLSGVFHLKGLASHSANTDKARACLE
jgi:hypothetical protein